MTNSTIDTHLLEEFEQLHMMSTINKIPAVLPSSSFGARPLIQFNTPNSTSAPKPLSNSLANSNYPLIRSFLPPQPTVIRHPNLLQSTFKMPSSSTARSLAQIARSAQAPASQVPGLCGVPPNTAPSVPTKNFTSIQKPDSNSAAPTNASSVPSNDCIKFTVVPLTSMDPDAMTVGMLLSRHSSRYQTPQVQRTPASSTPISSPSLTENTESRARGSMDIEDIAAFFSISHQREAAIAREAAFGPARAAPAAVIPIRPFAFDTPSPDDLVLLRRQRNQRN